MAGKSPWTVTAAADRFDLDREGRAEVTFTITNTSAEDDRAVFEIVAGDGAQESWFTVAEPQRPVPSGGSAAYLVAVAVPPGTPAGTFDVIARVYSADRAPEETSATSGRVAFAVAPTAAPRQRFPWWILAIVAAVLVVVIVVVVVVVSGDDESPPSPTVVMPDLSDLTEAEALERLDELGLTDVDVERVQDPGLDGLVTFTDPPADTEIDRDREVNVIVAVNLAAPVPVAPVGDAAVPGDQPVALAWEAVEHAGGYRIEISVESCSPNPDPFNPAPFCAFTFFNSFEVDALNAELPEEAKLVPSSTGRIQWTVVAVDDFQNAGFEAGTATFVLSF